MLLLNQWKPIKENVTGWNRFISALLGIQQKGKPMRAGAVYKEEMKSQLDLKRWTAPELLERRESTSGSKSTRNRGMMTGIEQDFFL